MKWMVVLLFSGLSWPIISQSNQLHHLGLRTGYFSTVGIAAEWSLPNQQKIIGTLGYRLPGGWLSYGFNTRLGGTLGWGQSKRILGDQKNGLSIFYFVGGYGASVSYLKNTHNFPKDKWFSFGLLTGGGFTFDWQVLHFAINILPGYELSGQPEWNSNWYFWKATSLSAGIKWNY
jgi:hypothetical protein